MKKEERNELFISVGVIADRVRRKLYVTKRTMENLHNLTYYTTGIYFQYKHRYPGFEEIIIPNLKDIPLNITI